MGTQRKRKFIWVPFRKKIMKKQSKMSCVGDGKGREVPGRKKKKL